MTGKLARWTLLLQEFEFEIIHQPGVQHAVADCLSRLELGESGIGVKDDFRDGQLFLIDATNSVELDKEPEDEWINDILCFLTIGLPLEAMAQNEKKRLVVQSRIFCVLHSTLYHKGADGI